MRRATILAYHAVGECPAVDDPHNLFVTPAAFAEQMEYLARNKRVVSLADAVSGRAGGRAAVAITFDDAYRNVLRNAAPTLQRFGFPATVFTPTAYLGERNTWIDPTPCDVDIMTPDELRELESTGISIESHGHDHIDFSTAPDADARADIERSREILSEVVGRDVRYFAYPYGRSSERSRALARELGLAAAFTIDRRHAGSYAWERVQVTPLDGPRLFALKCSGYYHSLRRSRLGERAFAVARPLVRRLRP